MKERCKRQAGFQLDPPSREIIVAVSPFTCILCSY